MLKSFILQKRDASVDIARGLAIIVMVAANMGPVLQEPHSLLMRISSSLPAPVFVTLAGMMMAHESRKPLSVIFKRAGWLLLVAAFTDMAAWGIRPFLGVDVLYLIGIGTLILYALRSLSSSALAVLAAAIVAATPFLQDTLGYTTYPTELFLNGQVSVAVEHQTPVWQHYIIDGWFPLFPWLAYMLGGALLARYHQQGKHWNNKKWRSASAASLIAGGLLWWLYPGNMYDRQGFSELFYPPTIGFFIASFGFVLAILVIADRTHKSSLWDPVRLMGQNSLYIYVLHSLVIGNVFVRLWQDTPLGGGPFLLVYILFLCGLFACTIGLRVINKGKNIEGLT